MPVAGGPGRPSAFSARTINTDAKKRVHFPKVQRHNCRDSTNEENESGHKPSTLLSGLDTTIEKRPAVLTSRRAKMVVEI